MAEPTPRVTVVAQSPEQIAAALATGRRIRILTAPWMAAAYGVRGLAPPDDAAGAGEIALDCGADAGTALAALRAGWKLVAFSGRADAGRKLSGIAAQMGARAIAPPAAPDIALTHGEDAAERLRMFFGAKAQRKPPHKGGHRA